MLQDTSKIHSLEEARREFSTVRKCETHLKRLRWPDGVTCPKCGAKQPGWIVTRHLWQCRACRRQFSVTAGTIFHRSHIDLPRWFVAIWLICHSPKGISAKQLERELGVSYETAWYMARRIRAAMRHMDFERKLCGIVEIDAGIIKADGGQATQRPSFPAKDVLGMAERGGAVRLVVLDQLSKAEIQRVVLGNLGLVKRLYSDMCGKLVWLREIAPHRTVNHWLEYVHGQAHVNSVENVWSLFKRGLQGQFHHVSAKYLQEYLDEFAFRHSHRHEKGRLFDLVLGGC
jgi:transposase-like protein